MARLTLRLPEDLHRRLRAQSQRRGLSMNRLIVSTLSRTVDGKTANGRPTSGAEELRQAREALGDLNVELDPRLFARWLGKDARPKGRLPRLNPPISATVIEDREDRV